MKVRHVDAAGRLVPDAVIFHAFSAEESAAWRRWITFAALAAVPTVVASLGSKWPVTLVAILLAGLVALVIDGPGRVVALTPDQALLFSTRRAALSPTADRLIDRTARDAVERSRAGLINERWRFGDRSLVVPRVDATAVDEWQTSTR